jgi:hypothetical protein
MKERRVFIADFKKLNHLTSLAQTNECAQ